MKTSDILLAIGGLAVGFVGGYFLAKKAYEEKFNEELNNIRNEFNSKREAKINSHPTIEAKPDLTSYAEIIKNYSSISVEPSSYSKDEEIKHRPEVVSPEEFSEYVDEGYEVTTLNFYSDGVLADERLNSIDGEELDRLIGVQSLTRFGEYEDDSVYVVNHELNTVYEILLDNSRYDDIKADEPSRVVLEDE